MPMWIDKGDNLEGNSFILVWEIPNRKSLVISCLYEVTIKTIYETLVQLNQKYMYYVW